MSNLPALRCPLSGSRQVQLEELIAVSDVAALYARKLELDVRSEFGAVTALGLYHCPESDLRFFAPAAPGSAQFYAQLQRFDWYYLEDRPEFGYVAALIGQADRVLEIGCGAGAFGRRLRNATYVGLELSPPAIAAAARAGLCVKAESVEQHAQAHPANYDAVCAFQVLEHVRDPAGFLAAAAACLRPGGLLAVSVPSADSFLSLACNNVLNLPPHHITFWSDRALHFAAGRFGLRLAALWHERLAPHHRAWYIATLIQERLRLATGRRRTVDRSPLQRARAGLAALGGQLLAPGLRDERLRPNGHTVCAVYRKD